MNCNICHHPNDPDNSYCENCGIKLLPSVSGEVWRAKDIVGFFSDSVHISFSLIKSLVITSVICALCYVISTYLLHWPTKYTLVLLIPLLWVSFIHYRLTQKVLKSLSLIDRNKIAIAHGGASLIGPAATIGGWLYLMKDGLIFTPESYYINSPVISISFAQLRSKSTESLGFSLMGDKFQIFTTEGQEFVFSVPERDTWLKLIDESLFEMINTR